MPVTYCVFGSPVLHSKSPQLFSPLFSRDDNVSYTRIRPQSATDLVNLMRTLDIRGASVTSPFKEEILPLIDKVSEAASQVGAVNCLLNQHGTIAGHNTDHEGVTGALVEEGLSIQNAKILVLGAGGAAKAAVYGLTKKGARVTISNRTVSKAKALANSFGGDVLPWDVRPGQLCFDAVVSALLPEAIPPFIGQISYDLLLDAIYKPSAVTAFTRERGIKVIGGERWLIHQGVEAAAFYMGRKPSPDTLGLQLNNTLNKKNLRILALNNSNMHAFHREQHDLVVSAFGLDKNTTKLLIDEEKDLAFGR